MCARVRSIVITCTCGLHIKERCQKPRVAHLLHKRFLVSMIPPAVSNNVRAETLSALCTIVFLSLLCVGRIGVARPRLSHWQIQETRAS